MEILKYRIKLKGIRIFAKDYGLITDENFTNEIAEYLLNTGQYNDIIEIIEIKENGFKKSNSKIHK